jgi:hypothetical protein
MYKFSEDFPFYFYPAIPSPGFYASTNMQNLATTDPRDSAIWTSKSTLGKFKNPTQSNSPDAQPFDIFAFRTIKISETKNLSQGMVNGCIGTFADELMAGLAIGTTYMPFVTSWIEVTGLENFIDKGAELLMVAGTDKVDGKNFFQRVLDRELRVQARDFGVRAKIINGFDKLGKNLNVKAHYENSRLLESQIPRWL